MTKLGINCVRTLQKVEKNPQNGYFKKLFLKVNVSQLRVSHVLDYSFLSAMKR